MRIGFSSSYVAMSKNFSRHGLEYQYCGFLFVDGLRRDECGDPTLFGSKRIRHGGLGKAGRAAGLRIRMFL
jgi:hypothetical protein